MVKRSAIYAVRGAKRLPQAPSTNIQRSSNFQPAILAAEDDYCPWEKSGKVYGVLTARRRAEKLRRRRDYGWVMMVSNLTGFRERPSQKSPSPASGQCQMLPSAAREVRLKLPVRATQSLWVPRRAGG